MTDHSVRPEGWYRDPYGIHEDRWFSEGKPTSLVRDRSLEAHDDPPDHPPPGPPLEIQDRDQFPQDDLRRADEAEASDDRYDAQEAAERAFNAAARGIVGNE
jgi:hypothetical protein